MRMSDVIAVLGFLAGIVLFVLVTVLSVRTVDRHYVGKNCPSRGISFSLPSKFVEYNFWSYECLVQIGDTWVPVNQYRGITNASR